ncbi:MAG: VOC family protein [Actinobacteria bacterium]|nr:VOC family protein [Actinomycetota bacterium]
MTSAIPTGLHSITPHIVVPEAAEASRWYQGALGAEERSRVTLPGGKVMTLELRFGDSAVMVAGEFPDAGILSPFDIGGTAVVLQLYLEDVQATWERAVAAGARVRHPLAEAFWGDLHGQIEDPFGHRWNLARHLRDVAPEEIAWGAAEAFGEM